MQGNHSRVRHGLATAITLALGIDGAHAAMITVTDGGDAATIGICTLRQAIASANNDDAGTSNCTTGSGDDTIVFAAALANQTITLSQGELDISSSLTITGSGQTIDANQASRVFGVSASAALTASHVTISGGLTTTGNAYGNTGGGIQAVGGASVNLSYVTIQDNTASTLGGGIAALTLSSSVSPSVTLSHCTVSGNHTGNKGAGVAVVRPTFPGPIPALTIDDSQISGNTVTGGGPTDHGGGIYLYHSTADIARTTISGNSAYEGGGVFGLISGIRAVDTTFSGNSAAFRGGGIFAATSGLSIANTTVAGNTAVTSSGGIIVVNDTANIVNSTISGNTAASSPGVTFVGNAPVDTHATLYNTIIADNGGDCDTTAGIPVVAKHNLLLTAGCGITKGTDGNLVGDPHLGALANNGGPTQTIAPAADSSALNAADSSLATFLTFTSNVPLSYDQRGPGYPRSTVDGTVDIGSYQHQGNERIFTDGFEPGP